MTPREHVPEGLTIIFEAKQRRGKTLGGVIWALDSFQRGRNVFSNIQLGFPHTPLEFNELELQDGDRTFLNGHIFIDELNFFFDSRRSMKPENITFSQFLLQQKKQGCHLTGTTHDMWSLDVRIRENFDYLVTPSVYPAYPEKPTHLRLEITNGPLQSTMKRRLVIPCTPYLGLYDSFAVYNPFKSLERGRKAKNNSRVTL